MILLNQLSEIGSISSTILRKYEKFNAANFNLKSLFLLMSLKKKLVLFSQYLKKTL